MNPCNHNPPCQLKDVPFKKGMSRPCWLYQNSEAYRAVYDGDPNVTVISTHNPEQAMAALRAMGIEVTEPPKVPVEQGPNWFRKAINFSKAVVKHAWHGLPETPTEEQERRLSICLSCEMLDPERGVCRHKDCGCAVAKKTTWLMEKCPLNKW